MRSETKSAEAKGEGGVEEEKKEEKSEQKPEEKAEEKQAEKPAEKSQKAQEEPKEKKEEKPTEKPQKKPSFKKATEDKPEPTGKFKDLIKQIEGLSVLELAELVKELEKRFGVSAAAPIAATTPGATADAEETGAPEEEKTEFTVVLKAAGDQKINAIKAVREVTDLGLKGAKDLVDAAPKEVKTNVKKEEAEEIKKKLESVGAQVELK